MTGRRGQVMLQTKYTTEEQIEEMREEILLEKQRGSEGSRRKRLKNRRRVLKIGGRLVFISVVLLLMASIVSINAAKSRGELPDILGFHLFVVESGSMEPTFNIGSVLLCRRPKAPDGLKANDIVTFRNLSGHIVTHRIIEVVSDEYGKTAYRTKGDNPRNSADQELLSPDRILAVFIGKIPLT